MNIKIVLPIVLIKEQWEILKLMCYYLMYTFREHIVLHKLTDDFRQWMMKN